MNRQIVAEVRRVLAQYGKLTTAWELQDIVRNAQVFVDGGMELAEAVDSAVVLVLRLYGIEDPPRSEQEPERRGVRGA